jgi:hypothetical protein
MPSFDYKSVSIQASVTLAERAQSCKINLFRNSGSIILGAFLATKTHSNLIPLLRLIVRFLALTLSASIAFV